MTTFWGIAGSVIMFLGVGLGAFAAHGLKSKLSADMLNVFEVGVRYQMIHGLMLFVVTVFAEKHRMFIWAGDFYLAGILLFSGSLYLLALGGPKWLGPVTPLGGLCFLAGHTLLAVAFWRAG